MRARVWLRAWLRRVERAHQLALEYGDDVHRAARTQLNGGGRQGRLGRGSLGPRLQIMWVQGSHEVRPTTEHSG